MARERGQVVDGEVTRPFGFIGFAQQLAAGHLAQKERLVSVGKLGWMRVLELVEQRQQLHGPTRQAGLLHHFAHHGPRRRITDVAPAPRQRPAVVAALLHQQDVARIVLNEGPHIQLGGGIAAVEGDPVADGFRCQLALAGDERHSGRAQRLETANIEGILRVGEARLRRGQHLFEEGGQRRLHY